MIFESVLSGGPFLMICPNCAAGFAEMFVAELRADRGRPRSCPNQECNWDVWIDRRGALFGTVGRDHHAHRKVAIS
jgi:hypothetical protein